MGLNRERWSHSSSPVALGTFRTVQNDTPVGFCKLKLFFDLVCRFVLNVLGGVASPTIQSHYANFKLLRLAKLLSVHAIKQYSKVDCMISLLQQGQGQE